MKYQDLKDGISCHLNSAAEDFFTIGYFLRQINEKSLFREDGYKNIFEFAKAEYGLSASSTSRFMAINARFSLDGGKHMDQRFIGMGPSKLQEMLVLSDEALESVSSETTVKELRAMKTGRTLSFFGLPATKRPKGSSCTTPGCGGGKYSCFSCSRKCDIRQEQRYCVTAPLGSPFPCRQIGNDFSFYKEQCMFLYSEFAPVRKGDNEPSPCCLYCEVKECNFCCDVAKKKKCKTIDSGKSKENGKSKGMVSEPTKKEIKALYTKWKIKAGDNVTAVVLKEKYRNCGGMGFNILKSWEAGSRGVCINNKKELTWSKLAKCFRDIQDEERCKTQAVSLESEGLCRELPEVLVPEQPDGQVVVIDVEGVEIENTETGMSHDDVKYSYFDVKTLFCKYEQALKAYQKLKESHGTTNIFLKEYCILVDALSLLLNQF